jgi:WD40 repeat protein
MALIVALIASTPTLAAGPWPAVVPRLDAEGFPLPSEAVRRLGSGRFLCGACNAIEFSPDGKTVFVAADGISAWDVATGKCRWRTTDRVHRLAMSADGKKLWALAVTDYEENPDTFLRLLDPVTGRTRSSKLLPKRPGFVGQPLTVSRVGTVAVATEKSLVVIAGDADKPTFELTAAENRPVGTGHVSMDGRLLLRTHRDPGDTDTRTTLVELATGKRLATVTTAQFQNFYGVVLTENGSRLFTFGRQPVDQKLASHDPPFFVIEWDTRTGLSLASTELPFRGLYYWVTPVLSPDGTRAVITAKGVATLYETKSWKRLRVFEQSGHSDQVRFSPDSKTLAVGGQGLALLDVATGKLLHGTVPIRGTWPRALWFTADGDTLTREYGYFGHIRYAVATGAASVVPDSPPLELARDRRIARSRDGIREAVSVVAGTRAMSDLPDGTILLSEVGKAGKPRELPPGNARYDRLDFTPDGRYLLAEWKGNRACVWDIAAAKKPVAFAWDERNDTAYWGHESATRLFPDPTGRRLAVIERNVRTGVGEWAVGIHDLSRGERLSGFRGSGTLATGLVWSGDGDRIGCRTENRLSVHNATTGSAVADDLKWKRSTRLITLSPDGRTVRAATPERVELIEVATGGLRRTFAANGVTALAPHPDGRHFATESATDGVLLWDALPPAAWPKEPDSLWADLGADAPTAHAAIRAVVTHPAKAIPLLKVRMAEMKPLSDERIAELVRLLGDRDFATREAATKGLVRHLDDARAALTAVATDPRANQEAKTRATRLLKQTAPNTPDRLRVLRAVEAAEQIGTPEAIPLLRQWSAGRGLLAAEATDALQRLGK